MSITSRGIVLLASCAALGLIVPRGLAFAAFGGALVAIVTDAFVVRHVPAVRVAVPAILSRGVPSAVVVEADPATGTRVKVAQSADFRIEPDEGSGRLEATITAMRRGKHTIPRPTTLRVGPLGLGCWYHRAGEETEVVVYPDMPQARRIAAEVRHGRFGEAVRRSRGPLGLGTDLESIRDYLPDDDIRQVNWRATARVGSPMSNTYRIDQEREVIVLLDTGRLMASPVGDGSERTRLDVAVDTVAAMAAVADEVGDRVGVLAFAGTIRRRLNPRRNGGEAVLAAVFDLEPVDEESDYSLAFRAIAHNKRAFVMLLTDFLEETASAPLAEAMPILARHHALAVASVSDPAVEEALTTPAPNAAEAIRTAVAVDIESSRRRAASRIERYGATVIDVPAPQLARRCVAAYLRAKSRARL